MHPRPHLADRLVCPLRVTIGGSGLRFVGGEPRPLRGMRSRPGAGGDVGGLGVLAVVESHARLDAGDPSGKQWIIDGGGVSFGECGESSGHGEVSAEPGHGGQPGGELAGEENELMGVAGMHPARQHRLHGLPRLESIGEEVRGRKRPQVLLKVSQRGTAVGKRHGRRLRLVELRTHVPGCREHRRGGEPAAELEQLASIRRSHLPCPTVHCR
ncbi:hypothetical protein E0504_22745 [Parafrankia sp. BMG5.11]|nr:hypothetical protein E0504_22745 [Parafrankia sp. BMG5.11]